MPRILFVSRPQSFNENIRFLLGLVGFEVTQVRNVEEAINLVEINESFCSTFHLLLVPMATLSQRGRRCNELIMQLTHKIKTMMIVRADEIERFRTEFPEFFGSEELLITSVDNTLDEVKKYFGMSESGNDSPSFFRR